MGDTHLAYRRARFATRLPADRVYTQGHFWLAPDDLGHHRIGLTRFATRMLGDVVEFEFEARPGQRVTEGQPLGWIEGFKAVSELYAPLEGTFVGSNPELEEDVSRIHRSPYGRGWLYRVQGSAPTSALDARGYADFLDRTIDRMTGRGS
jgi:glycine cleavage system H protein